MRKLRYQSDYWYYLMGNFINCNSGISILQTSAGSPTGKFYKSNSGGRKIESNSKNYKELYGCRKTESVRHGMSGGRFFSDRHPGCGV